MKQGGQTIIPCAELAVAGLVVGQPNVTAITQGQRRGIGITRRPGTILVVGAEADLRAVAVRYLAETDVGDLTIDSQYIARRRLLLRGECLKPGCGLSI